MRRKLLCGLAMAMAPLVCVRAAAAQPVPGRDLWDFPVGAVGAPSALSTEAGAGLWNPATLLLADSVRWQAGVASLSTGVDQGVEGQLAGVSWRRSSGLSFGLSAARAAVGGIVLTDTDPQSRGTVRYDSWLLSVAAARPLTPWLAGGAAVRWREGRADREVQSAIAIDMGLVARYAAWRDARLAVSSFLWRPGRENEDRPIVSLAADVRVLGQTPTGELRLGVAAQGATRGQSNRTTREIGPFASGRLGPLEVRTAIPLEQSGEAQVTRVRFAVALHLSRFVVGIAREDANVRLGPLYQFTFSAFGK